jgi:glutamyl endopeptidase
MSSPTKTERGRKSSGTTAESAESDAVDQLEEGLITTVTTAPTIQVPVPVKVFSVVGMDEARAHDAVASDGTEVDEGPETDRLDEGAESGGVGGAPGDLEEVAGFDERILERSAQETGVVTGEAPALDAWYAEFMDGNGAAVRLAQHQPEMVQQIAEVVIGADDRVRITNTTAMPWRWICALRITAANNTNWIGTGWLVGPRTVITAGHCVFMHNQGGWVKRVEVIPACNGAQRPYGSATATSFRSVTGWTQGSNRSYDYGAIILPSANKYGNQLGYFGYASLSTTSLMGLTLNLSGYPGDKPSGTQWFHARKATLVLPRSIVYNIDTAGGQSGAPVWRYLNGQRHVVGIHTNGSQLGNSATRIVSGVFNNIKTWKAQGM